MLYQFKKSPGPEGYQVTGNDLGLHWLHTQAGHLYKKHSELSVLITYSDSCLIAEFVSCSHASVLIKHKNSMYKCNSDSSERRDTERILQQQWWWSITSKEKNILKKRILGPKNTTILSSLHQIWLESQFFCPPHKTMRTHFPTQALLFIKEVHMYVFETVSILSWKCVM